jgi:deoxycytidylate deaminase
MTVSPFHAMQAAVDIVNTSQHPTNKIAASLFGTGPDGAPFMVSAINHWPDAIANKLGIETRIGSSSGTVHAETFCILRAPVTMGASIAITDPFCPNCAKNLVEAGIKTIYIDHKGFAKDFALRRIDDFTDMSMRLVERAGINVYSVNRRDQTITPIFVPPAGYVPPEDRPLHIITQSGSFDRAGLVATAQNFKPIDKTVPFAAAWVMDSHHQSRIMIAEAHTIIGYTEKSSADKQEMSERHHEKYSFTMEPVNRLLMQAAKLGYTLDPHLVISSRVPTAREQVNMVAAGLTHLHILKPQDSRDVGSINALHQLSQAGIINPHNS